MDRRNADIRGRSMKSFCLALTFLAVVLIYGAYLEKREHVNPPGSLAEQINWSNNNAETEHKERGADKRYR